jgi:hypothetical protein
MAKKPASPKPTPSAANRAGVTPERFGRLHLLVILLAKSPQSREVLARKLKLDVRGFYRDLDVLRQAGISTALGEGKYYLTGSFAEAISRLPFPDPLLTVGEAMQLAQGRGTAHKRLKQLIERRIG